MQRNLYSLPGSCSGVEFAGTLRDFVRGDLARKYPELMADVKVSPPSSHALLSWSLLQAQLHAARCAALLCHILGNVPPCQACPGRHCAAHVQVTLLQSGQTILTTFTGNLQTRALETFRKTGVDVRLGVRVTEVTANKVCI